MRAPLLPVLATAGALLLAGCLGPAQDATSAPAPTHPDDPETGQGWQGAPSQGAQEQGEARALEAWFLMFPYNGHLTLAAGAQGVGYASPTGAQDAHVFRFPVDANATALVVELRWDDAGQDLDLQFGSPSCDSNTGRGLCFFQDAGSIGKGDSPVRVVFTDAAALAETGDWMMAAWAKNAVNVDFEISATVFYGMDAPEGFSALSL